VVYIVSHIVLCRVIFANIMISILCRAYEKVAYLNLHMKGSRVPTMAFRR
jgi:hypothetical protein